VFALGFWLLQTQFVKLAGVYKFDYRLAYLIPSALMLGISSVLFRRRSGGAAALMTCVEALMTCVEAHVMRPGTHSRQRGPEERPR